MSTLWMGDLDTYMDEAFVTNAFAAMGETIVSVKIIKNRTTGAPAGYCFVDFSDSNSAQRALTKLNGLPVTGSNPIKRYKLNWATYGKDLTNLGPEFSIFVGDLTPEVTDVELQDFFQKKFSSCKAAKVVLDASGNSRGYGFVRFFDEREHKRAMTEMQGAVGCGGKPIRVSAATPKKPQPANSTAQTYGTTPSLTNQYNSYAQQYQQYQQYVQAWQGYHYQQYYQQYQQYPQYMYDYQQQTNTTQGQTYEQDASVVHGVDTSVEDPNEPIDIGAENKQLIDTDNELYYELENSRWPSVDSVQSSKLVTT
ncbi:tRNA selenocysteine 1-associated protein 1 isoform X2 [Exaiptasia diaphana]|uniref:tRNA selenocysteine-associated protein 1 n=1 Tax=Exaiptasia diaphana TaxID=2652724 RepID=A0A913XJP5_EXADI|nr:tRNA selenocysteine 1-associated protein 1 isoform X1 [Exaiptasia diaphana]XP_020905871.1 tRNA selenocysteine 1-associated protein 1 isoform X2 [Exaiptasia diaphana]KXJ11213.1 tRNA selenocysteine 1-associated protein 1 [Exaiptasia diaphana]